MATLAELESERARLLAEQEALNKEFGSGRGGREFLTGAKLEDWERRSLANDKALSSVSYQIRLKKEAAASAPVDTTAQGRTITTAKSEYRTPLTTKVDEDTGLLLLVDANNKTVARAALATDLNNIARSKGISDSDLPAPVDPREVNNRAQQQAAAQTERQNSEAANATASVNAANSQTAADNQKLDKNADGTGKNAGSNTTAEPLSNREKHALANRNVPSQDSKEEVVQSSQPNTNSGPVAAFGANAQNTAAAPNSGGGPVFTDTPTNAPTLSNGQSAAKSAEPALTYEETQRAVRERLSQQSVGSGTKKDATDPGGKSLEEKQAKKEKEIYSITYNPLNDYATYTYGFSLHVLTAESYNLLARGVKGNEWFKGAYTLIASGGRWGERDAKNPYAFVRPPEFKDDFYIDDITIKTIIGMTSETRGSNAVKFDFTITEPYGLTLVNRLLMLSKRINQPNYTENPYVLQLDFFGNTDGGDVVHPIPKITKYLPINILTMDIKVGVGGTTYTCTATAYNHGAFEQSVAATPADFEVSARTVGDFFASGKDDANFRKALAQRQSQREKKESIQKRANERKDKKLTAEEEKQVQELEAAYTTAISTKSYTQAYNLHQLFLKDNETIQHPTEIRFEIDEDIAKSPIVEADKNAVSNRKMSNPKEAKEAKQAASSKTPKRNSKTPAAGPNENYSKFNVKAGENILEIINKVIRSSKYMTDQLRDESKNDGNKEKKQIDLFKVIPRIELKEFDYKLNKWSRLITFSIIKSEAHNHKHPEAVQADAAAVLKDIRKKYEYIYTGENLDILDMEINFKTLFHTQVAVLQQNTKSLVNSQEKAADKKNTTTTKQNKLYKKNSLPNQKTNTVQPNKIIPVVASQNNMGFHSNQNEKVKTAADVLNTLYTSAGGDMVNLSLKIVGDPDFIKQDDVFYSPNTENHPGPDAIYSPNGSIMTDRGSVYCYVRFKTPVDIDLETGGLRNLDSVQKEYLDSSFTGVYMIVSVDNNFNQGRFEQVLTLVRIQNEIVQEQVAESIRQRSEKNGGTIAGQSELNSIQANATVQSGVTLPPREESYASYSQTQKAVVAAITGTRQEEVTQAGSTTNSDPQQQTKLNEVAAFGPTKTPDEQAKEAALDKTGTIPSNKEATNPSVASESSPPVDGTKNSAPAGSKNIDNDNLPSGVTRDPNTGLYNYRGTRIQANDSADLNAKISAIDNKTTITTEKIDPTTGEAKKVEFDGSKMRAESKDPEIANLQQQYQEAANAEWNAQRRLNNANSGMFDDDPPKKQNIITLNTKTLADAQQRKQDIEKQLRSKGAAPV
jgi:hypothetical protein